MIVKVCLKLHIMKKYLHAVLIILITGCNAERDRTHLSMIVNQEALGKHIEKLASDEFMGRMPFSEGEDKTVSYLKNEFQELGAQSGNGDSYFQEVPLVQLNGIPSEEMLISGGRKDIILKHYKDFMVLSEKAVPEVELDRSDMVFAGYGIVAPEYDWNDYEGIDWEGKTAVVLVNDPGFNSEDSTLFKGNELTYYGRWTYKCEEAARQGAAGVIIIHESEPAGYGWGVEQAGFTNNNLTFESDRPLVDISAWISSEGADVLFESSALAGRDYKEIALKKDFKAIPLGLFASVKIENNLKKDVSRNVIALIPGTDRKDEYIIYCAHWDHFGIGKPVDGDSIYNGAVDNATGTAALLALAEAFIKAGPTSRSIVLLAVTAEEQGLFGSAYYAENPVYEPEKTVAVINIDAILAPCPMKDLTIIGYGHSEMDDYAREAAEKQGRYIIPDPESDKGYIFRSDQFSFASIGIPSLYAYGRFEGFTKSIEEIKMVIEDYEMNKYHMPTDEFDTETFDLSGIQFDIQLLFDIGYKLANESYFPEWYDDSEFKPLRNRN